jgi:hypothetical protein
MIFIVFKDGLLDIENKVQLETYIQNRHLPPGSFKRSNDDYKNKVSVSDPLNCQNVHEHLTLDESRLTHPLNEYREMRTDHLSFLPYLHMSPQDVLVSNENWHGTEDRNGVSSRITLKGVRYREPIDFEARAESLKLKVRKP